MYSITEGFSPILCCRPDVSFLKNEEEAIPPGGKKYLGTIEPMEINVSVRGEPGSTLLSGGYAPDLAKAEGSSIVDEPGEG